MSWAGVCEWKTFLFFFFLINVSQSVWKLPKHNTTILPQSSQSYSLSNKEVTLPTPAPLSWLSNHLLSLLFLSFSLGKGTYVANLILFCIIFGLLWGFFPPFSDFAQPGSWMGSACVWSLQGFLKEIREWGNLWSSPTKEVSPITTMSW